MSESWPDGFVAKVDAEHRYELLKLQDDLLQGANREVAMEATIEQLGKDAAALATENERLKRELELAKRAWRETEKTLADTLAAYDRLKGELAEAKRIAKECRDIIANHQPAPSGDEAKVRELYESWEARESWPSFGGAVREAYAVGKADGARERREMSEPTPTDIADAFLAGCHRGTHDALAKLEKLRREYAVLERERRVMDKAIEAVRGAQMTEPTAEQIAAEMPRAREALGLVRFSHPIIGDDVARSVADVLARVRIEAIAAGRDEGLDNAVDAVHRECLLAPNGGCRCGKTVLAIRALRGRT